VPPIVLADHTQIGTEFACQILAFANRKLLLSASGQQLRDDSNCRLRSCNLKTVSKPESV
jgi:hypothetical protein